MCLEGASQKKAQVSETTDALEHLANDLRKILDGRMLALGARLGVDANDWPAMLERVEKLVEAEYHAKSSSTDGSNNAGHSQDDGTR